MFANYVFTRSPSGNVLLGFTYILCIWFFFYKIKSQYSILCIRRKQEESTIVGSDHRAEAILKKWLLKAPLCIARMILRIQNEIRMKWMRWAQKSSLLKERSFHLWHHVVFCVSSRMPGLEIWDVSQRLRLQYIFCIQTSEHWPTLRQ